MHHPLTIPLIFGLGAWEVVLIFFVILLLFGPKRLPELVRSLGKGIREFKSGIEGVEKELDESKKSDKEKIGSDSSDN